MVDKPNFNKKDKKITVLFLSANPEDQNLDDLNLENEKKEIIRRIEDVVNKNIEISFQFSEKTRPEDISLELTNIRPEILHIAAHGGNHGILFENSNGKGQVVEKEAIVELCRLFSSVDCVVLNSCNSKHLAEKISEYTNAIGMNGKIGDDSAIDFAVGFYTGIADNRTYKDSFDLGSNEIRICGGRDYNVPIFFKKSNTSNKNIIDNETVIENTMTSSIGQTNKKNSQELVDDETGLEEISQQKLDKLRQANENARFIATTCVLLIVIFILLVIASDFAKIIAVNTEIYILLAVSFFACISISAALFEEDSSFYSHIKRGQNPVYCVDKSRYRFVTFSEDGRYMIHDKSAPCIVDGCSGKIIIVNAPEKLKIKQKQMGIEVSKFACICTNQKGHSYTLYHDIPTNCYTATLKKLDWSSPEK